MSKYGFALQWMDSLGVKVYNKGQRILEYKGEPNYEISKLKTRIIHGQDLLEDEEELKLVSMSYLDMMEKGYIICAEYNPAYFWKDKQRMYLTIRKKRIDSLGISIDGYRKHKQTSGLDIQHDAKNRRFRIIGENVLAGRKMRPDAGISDWIYYSEDIDIQTHYTKPRDISYAEYEKSVLNQMYGGEDEKDEHYGVDELPLMISDEKYIIGLPKEDTCQRILVGGQPRKGKSLFCNSLGCHLLYKWEERVGWLMDSQNQFYDISAPQNYDGFNKILKLIGEEPKPLPAVQLYFASEHKTIMVHPEISLKLTIGFEEFLYKLGFYTYGIDEWKLKGSDRYLKELVPKIKNVETADEAENIFLKEIADSDKYLQMIYKWKSSLAGIFKKRFTSNLYQDDFFATHELEIVFADGTKLKGNPFLMLMMAGVVPVINISQVDESIFMRNYLADVLDKIASHQKELHPKHRKRLWIVADEMHRIYDKKWSRHDNVTHSFINLFKGGAFLNIGFIGNTQSLDTMTPELLKHATHICCFYSQSKKERKMIKDIFQLHDDEVVNQLGTLKKYEMMIFTNDVLTVYDRWGRKHPSKKRWYKGTIIPPVNYHQPPSGE